MKEHTEKRQLDLFNTEDTKSLRNLANRGGQELTSEYLDNWDKEVRKMIKDMPKVKAVISKFKSLFSNAVQMIFNFDLKFIIDMKEVSRIAKLMRIDMFSFMYSYQDAVVSIFTEYRRWKKESVFTLENIPSFVFIQE